MLKVLNNPKRVFVGLLSVLELWNFKGFWMDTPEIF